MVLVSRQYAYRKQETKETITPKVVVSDIKPIDTRVQNVGHKAHVTLQQCVLVPMWLSHPYPLEILHDVLCHLNPLLVLEVHLVLICLGAPPVIPPVSFFFLQGSIPVSLVAPCSPHTKPGDLGDAIGGVELPDPLVQPLYHSPPVPVLGGVLTIVRIPYQLRDWQDGDHSECGIYPGLPHSTRTSQWHR